MRRVFITLFRDSALAWLLATLAQPFVWLTSQRRLSLRAPATGSVMTIMGPALLLTLLRPRLANANLHWPRAVVVLEHSGLGAHDQQRV